MPECYRQTKKKRPCQLDADRQIQDGRWVCHVHDPDGTYRQQIKNGTRHVQPKKASRTRLRQLVRDGLGKSAAKRRDKAHQAEVRCMDLYPKRKAVLAQMGFRDYQAYLASPLWSEVRRVKLAHSNGLCECCGGPAIQVHHRKYSKRAMTGQVLGLLVAICGTCHYAIEFDDKGNKLFSVRQINARLKKLRRMFERAKSC